MTTNRKFAIKLFFKRIGILLTILVLCSAVLYFSLRSLNDSVSVLNQESLLKKSPAIIIDAGHGGCS